MAGSNHQFSSAGPAAVAWSVGLAWRCTRLILRGMAWSVGLVVRSVMAWAYLMAGRVGEDEAMVLRRRKWVMATFLAIPLALGTLFAPGLMFHTVGWIPMAASLPILGFSVVMVRRITRRSRQQPPTPATQVSQPVFWTDYQPTVRSTELEQALGQVLWHFAANGMSVDHALAATRAMPHRSQLWLLTVAEANLAALGRAETGNEGGLNFGNTEAAIWLFPFCQALRASTGLPSNVTTEPRHR